MKSKQFLQSGLIELLVLALLAALIAVLALPLLVDALDGGADRPTELHQS